MEALTLARIGSEAKTVQRVMGKHLAQQRDYLLTQVANCEPDLGQYAFYAGQLKQIFLLTASLEIDQAEGEDAVRGIREVSNG